MSENRTPASYARGLAAGTGLASPHHIETAITSTRPRERLLAHGDQHVSTEELLAIVLGTGTRGRPALHLAGTVLSQLGGLAALATAHPGELTLIHGIGAARAARVAAGFILGRRAMTVARDPATPLNCAEAVFHRLHPQMAGLSQEVFIVLALDARNIVIQQTEVARGTLTGVEVHPREVFRPLIRQSAAGAIVAHNHPSGDPTPSQEDLALTNRLREIGELVGIPVLDHIVIGHGDFVSIAQLLSSI